MVLTFDSSLNKTGGNLNSAKSKMTTSNQDRYSVSIQTNTDGLFLSSFSKKADAIKYAAYYRTGGQGWRGEFKEIENPQVQVYDDKKQEAIYCKPMFKYALKK